MARNFLALYLQIFTRANKDGPETVEKSYQHSIHTVMRLTCEQCGKSFSKPTKESAESALRMHVGRIHGNIKAKPAELTAREIRKREYQRRYRAQRRKMRHSRNGAFNVMGFCPRCGMNLEVLATALAVVNKA